MSPCRIRPLESRDLLDLTRIYNRIIATSTAIYHLEPVTEQDRAAWLTGRQAEGMAALAAEQEGRLVGFASYGIFRGAFAGYRYAVEHSVHVCDSTRGQGVGAALMQALIAQATAQNFHVMIGGIDADNAGSIRFHQRLGFASVGQFREVGHKFGRWLDLIFMQRFLDPPGTPRP